MSSFEIGEKVLWREFGKSTFYNGEIVGIVGKKYVVAFEAIEADINWHLNTYVKKKSMKASRIAKTKGKSK